MNRIFFYIILGLLTFSCDNSDDDGGITDFEGLSIQLSWDELGEANGDGIGLVLFDPQGVLLYQGNDSITIPNYLADGQFVCQVEIQSLLLKTDYKIDVQGLNGKATTYTFRDSFSDLDMVGFEKTALFIVKAEDNYTIEVP